MFDDIARRLFLMERAIRFRRPDHFHQNWKAMALENVGNILELLLLSLKTLAADHLEPRNHRIIVKEGRFESWQHLLPRIPPLPLISRRLYDALGPPSYEMEEIVQYTTRYIRPNLGATTLPSPHFAHLERHIEEKGLHEVHIHLNGTTELDHVWLHALENPTDFYKEFKACLESEIVVEQFEQIEPGLKSRDMYDRLRLAARLRRKLANWLYRGVRFNKNELRTISNLAGIPFAVDSDLPAGGAHPMRDLFPNLKKERGSVLEGLFYIHAFRFMDRGADSAFAQGLHLYLLLLGFFNKLLVQQMEQFGFDQFQKITNNEGRSAAERDYYHRFQQIGGAGGEDLAFVEGRFSPKNTVKKNIALLDRIFKGFAQLQGDRRYNFFRSDDIRGPNRMALRLTGHFIKKLDDISNMGLKVRHHALRRDLEKTARALLATRRHSRLLRRYFTGIDAAANELHAGPEVFAPIYRLFRRRGFVNFTFHAGEDFAHLISGLRTMWEAVHFLGLKSGNRIGHGNAVGIEPNFWLKCMGGGLVLSKGEWLDNLVFAHHLLDREPNGYRITPRLRNKIERLFRDIYHRATPGMSTLVDAWRMRRLDPLIACYPDQSRTDALDMKEMEEWRMIEVDHGKNPSAYSLFQDYHTAEYAKRGEEKMKIDLTRWFTADDLRTLQRAVLKELHARGVAIESMPTSNVRISFYETYGDHHLWRWLGLTGRKGGAGEESDRAGDEILPTVCLASDDPGIFATSLRNEYAHVYDQLIQRFHLPSDEAMGLIGKLADNARTFRFSDMNR